MPWPKLAVEDGQGARMRAREEAAQGIGPLLATSRGVGLSPTKAKFGA